MRRDGAAEEVDAPLLFRGATEFDAKLALQYISIDVYVKVKE